MKTQIVAVVGLLLMTMPALAEDLEALGKECASIWAQTWPAFYEPVVTEGEVVHGANDRYRGSGFARHESGVAFPYRFFCAMQEGRIDQVKSYMAMRHDQFRAKDGVRPASGNIVLPSLSQ
jgi:hypothetical protein